MASPKASITLPSVGLTLVAALCAVERKGLFQSTAAGLHNQVHHFNKPVFTVLLMFLGMLNSMWLHAVSVYWKRRAQRKHRRLEDVGDLSADLLDKTETAQGDPMANGEQQLVADGDSPTEAAGEESILRQKLRLCVPAIADLLGMGLNNLGQVYVSASVCQMLNGSSIIFTALLSFVVFRRKLTLRQTVGIGVIMFGLACVSVAEVKGGQPGAHPPPLIGSCPAVVVGVATCIFSNFLISAQMLLEERALRNSRLQPLQVIGVEGMFGVLMTAGVALPLMGVIPGNDSGRVAENTIDSLAMLRRSPQIAGFSAAYVACATAANVWGIEVTAAAGATLRCLLQTARTLFVWALGLALTAVAPDAHLGEHWHAYSGLQAAGFLLLVVGLFIYTREPSREDGASATTEQTDQQTDQPAGN